MLRSLSFTTDTGATALAAGFSDVTLHWREVPLAITLGESVIAYPTASVSRRSIRRAGSKIGRSSDFRT